MARPKRTPGERDRDLKELAAMYLRGVPQSEMAARFQVTQPQISYDLSIIRNQWKREASIDFGERQAVELAKIDRNERELWAAWEASKKAARKAGKAKKGNPGQDAGAGGDPRYMALIIKCTDQRVLILGLDAPITPTEQNEPLKEFDLTKLTDEQLKQFESLLAIVRTDPSNFPGTGHRPGDGARIIRPIAGPENASAG